MEVEPVMGINMGTTSSSVGVWIDNRVEIIRNPRGLKAIPSLVSFTETDKLVGDVAAEQAAINSENTVVDIKRLIGRKFSEEQVQDDLDQWPFTVRQGLDDQIVIDVDYKGVLCDFKPEEIMSMILVKLKESA
jgi:heat shock protein 1/8